MGRLSSTRFVGTSKARHRAPLCLPERPQLIFHRGAKKRHDVADFTFIDPSGLLTFVAPDRAVVALADRADTEDNTTSIVAVVEAWMRATRDA